MKEVLSMRKIFVLFLILSFVGLMSIGFSAKTVRVGIVYDVGGRGDKSFNDAAYAGLQRAIKVLKVENFLELSQNKTMT